MNIARSGSPGPRSRQGPRGLDRRVRDPVTRGQIPGARCGTAAPCRRAPAPGTPLPAVTAGRARRRRVAVGVDEDDEARRIEEGDVAKVEHPHQGVGLEAAPKDRRRVHVDLADQAQRPVTDLMDDQLIGGPISPTRLVTARHDHPTPHASRLASTLTRPGRPASRRGTSTPPSGIGPRISVTSPVTTRTAPGERSP